MKKREVGIPRGQNLMNFGQLLDLRVMQCAIMDLRVILVKEVFFLHGKEDKNDCKI